MNSVNEDLLERAYEILEVICDNEEMQDLAIEMNQAIHSHDLEQLYFLIKTSF